MDRYLILGAGYTGSVLKTMSAPGFQVIATHRTPDKVDPSTQSTSLHFDLQNPDTWINLTNEIGSNGHFSGCFWTFPAMPMNMVSKFLNEFRLSLGKLICIGTTSSILVNEDAELVDEATPARLNEPRVLGEELLRHEALAVVVRAAGIYGPERNPLRWVESGRVTPSERYVNFVHVEDLAQFLWAAMKSGKPGTNYLASDSHPKRWNELCAVWEQKYGVKPGKKSESNAEEFQSSRGARELSKRVDSTKSWQELGCTPKYPSVIEGVAALM